MFYFECGKMQYLFKTKVLMVAQQETRKQVTVHFIDPKNETQLSSVLLGCKNFHDKHTAYNLAIFFKKYCS